MVRSSASGSTSNTASAIARLTLEQILPGRPRLRISPSWKRLVAAHGAGFAARQRSTSDAVVVLSDLTKPATGVFE
jgi:hypothetical protein